MINSYELESLLTQINLNQKESLDIMRNNNRELANKADYKLNILDGNIIKKNE